jgi:speedy protein
MIRPNGHLKRLHSDRETNVKSYQDKQYSLLKEFCNKGLLHLPKLKVPRIINVNLITFLDLLDNTIIQNFFWVDSCAKLSDRYLIAMVYVYFKRAHLPLEDYTVFNFFVALYLANDLEEDNEGDKCEILPWACGKDWINEYTMFIKHRDMLWCSMGFRAVVSKKVCDEVMLLAPDHLVWGRHRYPHHGGALRSYTRDHEKPQYGYVYPSYCKECELARSGEVFWHMWPSHLSDVFNNHFTKDFVNTSFCPS